MPKLMSMAKTVVQIRDGFKVHVVGDVVKVVDQQQIHVIPWSSFYDIRDGRLYKDVTRRGGWFKKKGEPKVWRPGWAKAKSGDVVELVEWSPRVPKRWACACGWIGTTKAERGNDGILRYPVECPFHFSADCHLGGDGPLRDLTYRAPQRLGLRRIVTAEPVRLGDIDAVDLVREGFPGMTPEEFVAMFCAPGKPYPDGLVTRIVLARVEEQP